ncbi:hypothetical protein AB0L13_47060 [Saccharopolyspora shandongensis]|uniref:hypothetical protein n=1 Tax=Saccharopolyspora shandongensis TaxID=418495 RepID=UPI00343C7197
MQSQFAGEHHRLVDHERQLNPRVTQQGFDSVLGTGSLDEEGVQQHRQVEAGKKQPVNSKSSIAHFKVCTRHGTRLSGTDQPNLDVTPCPEIITAQHRANRLLRRYTPQQLVLAHEVAVAAIPPWPASRAVIPHR